MTNKNAEKFRKLAQGLDSQIEKRSNLFSNCNMTARRARFIESGRQEAERLEKLQKALNTLADLWDNSEQVGLGSLALIKNKKQLELLLATPYQLDDPDTDCVVKYSYYEPLVKAGINSKALYLEARNLLLAYMNADDTPEKQQERERQRELRKLELNLIGTKIPGYFPTPAVVVDQLLDLAEIEDGHIVLEPSAGKGNIADRIKERYPHVTLNVCEINSTLRDILTYKGHDVIAHDFMGEEPLNNLFCRIVANPPFENYQDVDHVYKMYKALVPGGVMVSIMASSAFNNTHKKAQEFRSWLQAHNAEYEKLPDKSFMSSERPTGVSCYWIKVRKPE